MKPFATYIAILALCTSVQMLPVSAQWKEATIPAPFNASYYLDIYFLPGNPNLGWACSITGDIVRTTDGGTTWRGTTIPGAFLEYIQFLTPQIGYTSGQAGVFRSVNGGASWYDITPFDPNNEKGWGSFWINQNEGLYFVGGCATGLQAFYRTTDAGSSWSVSYGSEPQSGLSDGIVFNNGSGYAVSSGVLWRTSDFGRSWSYYSSTGAKVWNEELAINGNSFLIPSSGNNCDGNSRGIGSMRFSTDGGRTWNEYQTGTNMFGSFLVDERRGWGVGDSRTVIYTSDYGTSWTLRNCGIRGNIDDIFFINDTLGWAAGEGIYRSNFNAPIKKVAIDPKEDSLAICRGDSVFVTADGTFGSYQWNDGVNAQGRFLTKPGRYIVSVTDGETCIESSDTMTVVLKSAFEPSITASAREICEGDSASLFVAGPITTWLWSTGEKTSTVSVSQSGMYTCTTLDSNGCLRTTQTTITVHPRPVPVIQTNRSLTICLDDVLTLSAQDGFRSYEWSTGEISQSITTAKGGSYAVTVTDNQGCVGTSDSVRVTALDTRNKADVQFSASDGGVIVVQDHDVGMLACRIIKIRNLSIDEPLLISKPFLVGNVYFSIPQSQLPITIAPGDFGELQICASAIDSGLVFDTLGLPDTCSTSKVIVRSRGLPILFNGTSRCNVSVDALVYRAGSSWRLSAPFPVPASTTLTITATLINGRDGAFTASLLDVTGRIVASSTDLRIIIGEISPGPYVMVVEADGEPVLSCVVTILR